jgi:hypothetical protein
MKTLIKKVLYLTLGLLILIQLVPVSFANPPEEGPLVAPDRVQAILKSSCFDCHSNRTVWPWYSRVAPVSWWLVDHVTEGRSELNFSNWQTLSAEKQIEMTEEILEEVEEGEMPPRSYTLVHSEASLSQEDIQILREWVGQNTLPNEIDRGDWHH